MKKSIAFAVFSVAIDVALAAALLALCTAMIVMTLANPIAMGIPMVGVALLTIVGLAWVSSNIGTDIDWMLTLLGVAKSM